MQRTFRELREDVEAKKAAAAFDREVQGKVGRTFFSLLQVFLEPKLLTRDIAGLTNVDAVSMSKLYRDWFAEFVGFPTAHEREEYIKWQRVPLIQSACAEVKKHDLLCEFPKYEVRRQNAKAFATRSALIGGHFCSIRELTKVRHMSSKCKQFYGHTTVHKDLLDVFEFVAIHFNVEGYDTRWYVLPSTLLREKKLHNGERDQARLVIPALPRGAYSREEIAINYQDYENAWHMLKAPEALRAIA